MLGVPLWILAAVLVGAGAAVWLYGGVGGPDARTRAIVEGLRSGAVYEAPGAPGIVDAGRARAVIGDRAIVAVVLDRTPLPPSDRVNGADYELCKDIAEQLPTNHVALFAVDEDGDYGSSYCLGPDFPEPEKGEDDADLLHTRLLVAAETSWKYRASPENLTPEIEEFVLSYDLVAEDAYEAIPTRGEIPDELAKPQIALASAGIVAGTVAVFFLLRLAAHGIGRRGETARLLRQRRIRIDDGLSRAADTLLHPHAPADEADARRQEKVAHVYATAVDRMRDARTEQDLREVEELVRWLREASG
ncbi:hypothetical protein CFN78_02445 [Amycolatopsis antarctica]|uniref:Uncharacterized protein n=1 Tax=Amycolatopsis antarctica TaxID=1854586 RepID=A0A263DC35_9PSEU|nr:hypothetical protein CFN78_02445 [Amycolatopsis antarctica]